jgi:hypothetical protein
LAPVETTPAEAPAEAAEEKPALEPSDLSKRIDALIEEKLKVTPILEPISEDIPGAAEKAASSPAASADLATETSIRAALAEADAAGFAEVYSSDLSLTFGGGMYVLPDGYVNGSEQAQRQVRLGPQWKGSDADLAVLRDLNHAAVLEISDRKLTDAALEHIAAMPELAQLTLQNVAYDRVALRRFKKLRPEVNVHAFGPAILGISGEPAEEGFLVNHVVPESGAAKGGIESGDVIRRIDGETVDSFEALTLVIAPHKPGDTVSLEFTRRGEAKTGRAALGAR